MREKTFLGLDVGTSGVKGIVINARGDIAASAFSAYALSTPRPNWAEQDPDDWWKATLLTLKSLAGQSDVRNVEGIGLSGQMHSLVLLDKDFRVLRPAILWCDTRNSQECEWLNESIGEERLRDLAANPAMEGFTLPKILWVRDHEPRIYDRIRHVLLPKDFIRWKLTGEFFSDFSDASGTLAFDVRNRVWSEEILSRLSIPRMWLPDVQESSEVSGCLSAEVSRLTGFPAKIPVVAGGADNACAALGAGIVREGQVLASIGTSGVMIAHEDSPGVEPRMRVHTFCHSVPGKWFLIGVVLMAGGAFRWFKDVFGGEEIKEAHSLGSDPYDVISQRAEKAPPGCEGLFFQPYLAGERTPHRSASARASFVGATLRHSKPFFARAVLEGITYAMRDSLEIIKSVGIGVSQVRLAGGGARNQFWRQLQADVYGSDVALVNSPEGPAFGAALLAAAGTKFFTSPAEAAEETVRVTEVVSPQPDAVRLYDEFFAIYSSLYPALDPVYSRINNTNFPEDLT